MNVTAPEQLTESSVLPLGRNKVPAGQNQVEAGFSPWAWCLPPVLYTISFYVHVIHLHMLAN